MRRKQVGGRERQRVVNIVVTEVVRKRRGRINRNRKNAWKVNRTITRDRRTKVRRVRQRRRDTIETNRKILNKVVKHRGEKTLKVEGRNTRKTTNLCVVVIKRVEKRTVITNEPTQTTITLDAVTMITMIEHKVANKRTELIKTMTITKTKTTKKTRVRGVEIPVTTTINTR